MQFLPRLPRAARRDPRERPRPRGRFPDGAHLGDDHDVSGALEETVRDLDIDFRAERAPVGAMPLDGELVWNRMDKALILGAANETLGDEWVDRHGA